MRVDITGVYDAFRLIQLLRQKVNNSYDPAKPLEDQAEEREVRLMESGCRNLYPPFINIRLYTGSDGFDFFSQAEIRSYRTGVFVNKMRENMASILGDSWHPMGSPREASGYLVDPSGNDELEVVHTMDDESEYRIIFGGQGNCRISTVFDFLGKFEMIERTVTGLIMATHAEGSQYHRKKMRRYLGIPIDKDLRGSIREMRDELEDE